MTYNNVTINTSEVVSNKYTILVTEGGNSAVKIVVNDQTGKIESIEFGEKYNAEQVQAIVNKFSYDCANNKDSKSCNNRTMDALLVSTTISVLGSVLQKNNKNLRYISGKVNQDYLDEVNKTNIGFLRPLQLNTDDFNKEILSRFKQVVTTLKAQTAGNDSKILFIPYPIKGKRGGGHMILAVVDLRDLKNLTFRVFDSSPYSNDNYIGDIENQFKSVREAIKIEGFNNDECCTLLNPKSTTYVPPQTVEGHGDCTYWVEATILVLSEIISQNPKITLDSLSGQLMDTNVQRQIQNKHDEILATNGNIVRQQNKTQQTQQTNDGFGDFDTTEQNTTTPPVPQPNITPPKQAENTSVMSKAISSSFPGINIMKIENCQNNGNTTPKPSLLNIPTDKTQDTSRSQSVPGENH